MKALFQIQLSAVSLLLVLIFSFNGYGITDEGFALNVLEAKVRFEGLFSQYYLFYSPVFHWLGRNITLIRFFNILTIYLSSYLLLFIALKAAPANSFVSQSSTSSVWSQASILRKSVPALSSLSLLSLWPYITPTYSHSTFLGVILISFLILVPSLCSSDKTSLLISLVAGSLGTYLLLLSKLPTAVIFISSILLFAIFARFGRRRILLSIVIGMGLWLIHLSVVTPGGFSPAFNDLALSSQILSNYDANAYSVFDLLKRLIPGKLNLIAFCFSCLSVYCLRTKFFKRFIYRLYFQPLTFYLSVLFLAFPLLLFFIASQSGDILRFVDFLRLSGFSFLSSFTAFVFFCLLFDVFKSSYSFSLRFPRTGLNFFEIPYLAFCDVRRRSFYCQLIYFFFAPFSLAFFTTNAFYEYLSQSVIFWALLILLIWTSQSEPRKNLHRFLVVSIISPLFAFVFVLNTYLVSPYTQQSFYGGSLSILSGDDQLLLFNSDQLSRLKLFRSALQREGFKPNDLLLDLTGGLPGFQYFIDAKPVGWPWILGYAPGSTNVASSILENVDYPDILNAWIVIKNAEANPNLDSKTVLNRLDLDLSKGDTHQLTLVSPCLDQRSGDDCSFYVFKPVKQSKF